MKSRQDKAVVKQDNRFVFAKYNMSTNELKLFMWIVAQVNSQRDQLFQICEIPVKEIFGIFDQKSFDNYTYIRNLCESMLKKTYIEDFRLLDERTMKEVKIFQGYTLFEYIRYQEGEAVIQYKLNDFLMQYLLDLKGNFTQLKFSDIQRMKSSYSIRIYNMLLSELKQNRQFFEIKLSVLQNILETPKSLKDRWSNFKKVVLDQTVKDINSKTNMILYSINILKEGKKITSLRFNFDYKSNEKKIKREKQKKCHFLNFLASQLSSLLGKSIFFGKSKAFKKHKAFHSMEELFIYSYEIKEQDITLLIQDRKTKQIFSFNKLETLQQVSLIKQCVRDAKLYLSKD